MSLTDITRNDHLILKTQKQCLIDKENVQYPD